jgi:hypothetical protein
MNSVFIKSLNFCHELKFKDFYFFIMKKQFERVIQLMIENGKKYTSVDECHYTIEEQLEMSKARLNSINVNKKIQKSR